MIIGLIIITGCQSEKNVQTENYLQEENIKENIEPEQVSETEPTTEPEPEIETKKLYDENGTLEEEHIGVFKNEELVSGKKITYLPEIMGDLLLIVSIEEGEFKDGNLTKGKLTVNYFDETKLYEMEGEFNDKGFTGEMRIYKDDGSIDKGRYNDTEFIEGTDVLKPFMEDLE